tara:strand:+ start:124 stop:1935 length:1812 start_codon:yes stop_codon:yes gene_type:complete
MPYYTDEEIPSSTGMEQFGLQYDPSLSVIFGESLSEGWRQITPNLARSYSDIQYAGGTVYEDEEQWKSSEFFREGLKFEERMTEGQARLLAERYDRSAQYSNLVSRANSLGDYGAIFGGMLIGSIPDPINFIPWLGFVKKGKQAKSLIDATTRGKAALRGGAEAAIGTAAFHPLFALEKGAYQEEYDISMALIDVGIGAGIGVGLGSIFGRIHPDDPTPATSLLPEPEVSSELSPTQQLQNITEQVRSQVWRGLDHVPPQSRVMAASLAHAQMASGQTVDAARFLNQVEIDTSTMEGAPSGLIRGSFQDSVLNNEDGTLQTWYHGTIQRPNATGRTDAYETILPGRQTGGLISFTSDPEIASGYGMSGGGGFANIGRAESMSAYRILADEFPDVFEFDPDTNTGRVLNPDRIKDEDVAQVIFDSEPRDKNGISIKVVELGNTVENMVQQMEEGFQELSSGGVVYPRFLNVKNPYPEVMDYREAEKLGAEWFKERGYDAVYSTEAEGKKVIFTVDPNQSKSVFDPEFTQFNEATSADPLPPVDETPVRNEFELEEENIDLEIAARESELTEQDAKDLAEMDQMVADVDRQAQAYRAAADCVMRT